ncbi:MAG: gliding motility protein GldN [Prevotellaceae bacterium]|jgi:gliding motility associated protien GldN|nr:gliding motility protein GldN [Prevotellaceae bacterium]
MKKILIFNVLFAFLFSYVSFAQEENNENVEEEPMEFMVPKTDLYDRAIVETKAPVTYAEVREEDQIWSQFVWRIIDCREKMNFHLYYPVVKMGYRKSLAQALLEGIIDKKVQAYSDQEYTNVVPLASILTKLDATDKEKKGQTLDGNDTTLMIKGDIDWSDVREYKIKEKWFFDKRHSRYDVRIIAICPMRVFKKKNAAGEPEGEELRTELFWVYFPEARRVLANTICFTGKNQTANISFDDIFFKRYFSSRIIQEANVNDIPISDYTRGGLEAILESERIKTKMLQFESDLWNY